MLRDGNLTAWLRRAMRGQKAACCVLVLDAARQEVRQKALLLECRGRWVVRVVERRRVVVLPGLFRPWASLAEKYGARLN